MNFSAYCEIIQSSVAAEGYDEFLPSLCVLEPQFKMQVLATELSDGGEEVLALEWARSVAPESPLLYIAYRIPGRRIEIAELQDMRCLRKLWIECPSSPTAGQH